MSDPVVLVSFFDGGIAFGVRSLYGALRRHGIPAKLLHFGLTKGFRDVSAVRLLQCRFHLNTTYVEPVTREEYDQCVAAIRAQNPLLVGLSVESRMVPFARALTVGLAEQLPEVPLIWGGIHPTVDTNHSLKFVDTVCVGEGEEALVEVVQRLQRGDRDFRGIPNLAGRAPDGSPYNGPLRLIENLDSLPLPLVEEQDHLFVPADIPDRIRHLKRNEGVAIYEAYNTLASRGCAFSCSYCYSEAVRRLFAGLGTRYLRRRGVDSVLREIKSVVQRKNYRFIAFWDDLFENDETWLREFSSRYRKEIGLPFGVALCIQLVNDRVVNLLKAAGCHSVGVGIQTGSVRVNREIYKRAFDKDQVLRAAALLNSNFDTFYHLILENPYEEEGDIRETIELFRRFPHPFRMSGNALLWFPGQGITRRALEDGKIVEENILGHYPDDMERYCDITHPKPGRDRASRRRYSLYLIAFAMQHSGVDRDAVANWANDSSLLEDPSEVERRLAFLYLNESESDFLDLRARIDEQNALIASLRGELQRKESGLEAARPFL